MSESCYEIVGMCNDGTIVVADPFDATSRYDVSLVNRLIDSINERARQRAEQFEQIGDLGSASSDEIRKLRIEIEDDDDLLMRYDADLRDGLLRISGFKAFVVQARGVGRRIDPLSVRGKFAAMIDALKAEEQKRKIVEPPRSWVVHVEMNGDQFKRLSSYAQKLGCPFQHFAVPQNDAEMKKAASWFERNV